MAMTGKLCVLCVLALLVAGCCSTRSDFDSTDCYGYPPCNSVACPAMQAE